MDKNNDVLFSLFVLVEFFYSDLFLKVQKSWATKHHKAYVTGSADVQFIPVQRMLEWSEYE